MPAAIVGQLLTNSSGRAAGGIAAVVLEVVYGTVLISVWGRTVGNRASGTAVVIRSSGQRPDGLRSLVRTAAPAVLGVPAIFSLQLLSIATFVVAAADILWPLWDRENQTLHDKIAGTLVVKTQ